MLLFCNLALLLLYAFRGKVLLTPISILCYCCCLLPAACYCRFSRRMVRLLTAVGGNATLEELPGKQHWWWDSSTANDGGVMNDPSMRR